MCGHSVWNGDPRRRGQMSPRNPRLGATFSSSTSHAPHACGCVLIAGGGVAPRLQEGESANLCRHQTPLRNQLVRLSNCPGKNYPFAQARSQKGNFDQVPVCLGLPNCLFSLLHNSPSAHFPFCIPASRTNELKLEATNALPWPCITAATASSRSWTMEAHTAHLRGRGGGHCPVSGHDSSRPGIAGSRRGLQLDAASPAICQLALLILTTMVPTPPASTRGSSSRSR